jgi:hypothetical protein
LIAVFCCDSGRWYLTLLGISAFGLLVFVLTHPRSPLVASVTLSFALWKLESLIRPAFDDISCINNVLPRRASYLCPVFIRVDLVVLWMVVVSFGRFEREPDDIKNVRVTSVFIGSILSRKLGRILVSRKPKNKNGRIFRSGRHAEL